MATKTVYAAEEGQRFSADRDLVVVDCPTCSVTYAIPESFYNAAHRHNSAANPSNYWSVCCPFGHSWHYTGLNREQQLERDLQRANDRAGRIAADRDQTTAALRAQKARATRFKNDRDRERARVAAGVCPCCNRTFKQLARHMKSQHPDFPTDELAAPSTPGGTN